MNRCEQLDIINKIYKQGRKGIITALSEKEPKLNGTSSAHVIRARRESDD